MKRHLLVSLLVACGGSSAKPAHPVEHKEPIAITTAEQVIEQSIANEGGRDKLAKITSLHMHGTLMIAQLGTPGTLETLSSPPNNSLTRLEIKGVFKDEAGVKGDLAWEKNTMMGARILAGAEKSMALREAQFNGDLIWKQLYPKAELKGIVKFADIDCYQVVLTATDGQVQTRYYAKDTFLPIGLEMVAESQMGKVSVKLVSSDWREVNGFKYPHKMKREEAAQAIEITIDKIETNVPIPPETFEPSDEIKQLAAAAPK